ncbi:YdcF family protein [Aureimonas frigidaquae]|uniref:YdcF family protein n=1 Tax=Aureimonas frigidaquae TaxID=424757 RepID=UPI0007852AFA|nr:YdcF family protein [Aureimonas frigidaquae]
MSAGQKRAGRGTRTGFVRRAAPIVVLVLLALTAYFLGGFLRFANDVAGLRAPASIEDVDGIVVLTGGELRLSQAMRLLKETRIQRLLISGVNPGTTPAALARVSGGDPALFDCCVDLDYAALDTIGNARMTVAWAHQHDMRRIALVTSDYHIPRALTELANVEGAPAVVPYPVSPRKLWRPDGLPTPLGLRLLAQEYLKVLAARARIHTGFDIVETLGRRLSTPSVG